MIVVKTLMFYLKFISLTLIKNVEYFILYKSINLNSIKIFTKSIREKDIYENKFHKIYKIEYYPKNDFYFFLHY